MTAPIAFALPTHNSIAARYRTGRWHGVRLHVIVVVGVALTLYASPETTLIVGGLLITPAYLALGFYEARRVPLFFCPLSFYFFWFAIANGVAPFYMVWLLQSDGYLSFSRGSVSSRELAIGYVLFLVGSVAFHTGMQWLRPLEPVLKKAPQGTPMRIFWWIALMLAIGGAIIIKPSWFAALGQIARPLQAAPLAALVMFGVLGRQYFGFKRDTFRLLFGLGTATLFVMNLRSGSKAYLMFSFLPLLWMMLVRRELRRWLPLLATILAAIYFFVIAPTVNSARGDVLAPGESLASHLIYSFHPTAFLDMSWNSVLTDQVGQFLIRDFDPTAVGFLVGEVERDGLKMGETMSYADYAFIPRLVWPDKPNVSKGGWFYAYVGGGARESESGTSLGITATGELYWNFGVAGVLLGMFVLGAGYGYLWRMAGTNPLTAPLHMLLYVLITTEGMINQPQAVSMAVSILSNILLFGAIFAVFRSWKQRRQMAFATVRAAAR